MSLSFPENNVGTTGVNNFFSEEDALGINLHENDPLATIIQHDNWDIRHILIDPGSLVGFLFWDVF